MFTVQGSSGMCIFVRSAYLCPPNDAITLWRLGSGKLSHTCLCWGTTVEEGLRQKRRPRSSLLFGGRTYKYHLAARMIWRKVFGRTSILIGWWFGMMWRGMIIHFLQSIHSIHPLLQIILDGGKSVVRHGIEWILHPNSSDDLCLLFCVYGDHQQALRAHTVSGSVVLPRLVLVVVS